MATRYRLQTDHTRVPLDGGSVLLGRNFDCDIVLTDERVSRHHALVRVTDEGVEVVPLSARGITVNGSAVTNAQRLNVGESFEVEGQRFTLHAEAVSAEADLHWFVEHEPGVLVRVPGERVTLGGASDDDIVVERWPAHAIALAALGERLVLEVTAPGVRVDRDLEVGEMLNVANGDRIACGPSTLKVVALPSDPSKPTAISASDEVVSSAVLAFYPRGGRLALRVGARERKVYLAGRRSELVALLLRPPAPWAVGDLIPDTVLVERLWPGSYAGRTDINTLLWRVRRDFADAGLDRVTLFERTAGGLRLRLAEGAFVEVRGTLDRG